MKTNASLIIKLLSVSKLFIISALILAVLASCSKSSGTVDSGGFGNNPRSEVPDDMVGYWLAGSSSIGNFWGYDGSYQGAAYELALGYMLYKDGRAKQYFYYTNTSSYCRTQVLGYKEGTVKIDPNTNSFEFFAASGNYRGFNSCGSSQSPGFGTTKKYGAEELYPNQKVQWSNFSIVDKNGKKVIRVPLENNEFIEYEKSSEPQR